MENSRNGVRDYNIYHLTAIEMIFYCTVGCTIVIILGRVFYQSWFATIIMCPIVNSYIQIKRRELSDKEKENLNHQFKEAIIAVSNGLRAGYSIENAFREAYRDITVMFGKESNISIEFLQIVRGIDNNIVLERLLFDFADRSNIDNILDFAEIFQTAKRSGGDMNIIIQTCVMTICDKMEVKKEIQTILCSKQLEQKIMNLIPILIILYIRGTSPGFFDPLYHNITGIAIMTVCLILYGMAYKIGKKIITIQM